MSAFILIWLFVIGAVLGSFIAALTWRVPRGISIAKGRSFCVNCKKQIAWYDNIPLLSYLLLGARCRRCENKISTRYFYIELSAAILFPFLYFFTPTILNNVQWLRTISVGAVLIFVFILGLISLAVFIVDWEHQIIPDEFVFFGFIVSFLLLLLSGVPLLYANLLAGFLYGLFLLAIVLATRGAGMGLGDVKLALFYGLVLGPKLSFVWMFLSFVLGAIIGLMLIAQKKTSLKSKIAFGPFLVASFMITLVYGRQIFSLLLPYIN